MTTTSLTAKWLSGDCAAKRPTEATGTIYVVCEIARSVPSFHERNFAIEREFLWLATSGHLRSAEFADRRRNEGQIPPVQ